MRHLTTAKADRDLCFIAFLQKPSQVAHLYLVITLFRTRPELHFLDLDLLLLLTGDGRLLALLELELAVVHHTAHRRLRRRYDFDQIQISLGRYRQSLFDRDNAAVFAFGVDQPDLPDRNLVIQAYVLLRADMLPLQ